MIHKIIIKVLLVLMSITPVIAQNDELMIIPMPQQINQTDDIFILDEKTISLECSKVLQKNLNPILAEIKSILNDHFNVSLSTKQEAEKKLTIELLDETELNRLIESIPFDGIDLFRKEGYLLQILEKNIKVRAVNVAGLFYGLQSLKQLLIGNLSDKKIDGVIVIDWPDFKYRAISDDISRGPLPTMDYMKYQVRRLSEMKINTIIHYVEHVVKTESHPEFAPDEGSLTIEEWREIADYALKYKITVIGGFQSFGHFQKILQTPEYAHLGESGSLISPMLPESYEFLENIYTEMIPAFHSEFFNVNCDETFDLGKEASKQLVDKIGYAEVYYQHMMKLYNIVKKHGKRMIMWGDIMMQHPELLDKIPKDVLIGTWNYDARETFKNYIDPFKNSGFEFWVVPGVLNSHRMYPDFNQAFNNIKVFITEGYNAGASGVLNCFWDDGGTGFFSNDWYGAAYGADKSWNHKSDDLNFDTRYGSGSLGTDNNNLMKAIRKLNELRFLELTDGMTDKFMFTKLLPDQGKDFKISLADLEKVMEILDESEKLLSDANLKFYLDDVPYIQFIIDYYRVLSQERFLLLETAQSYALAENFIDENPALSRKQIVKSIKLVNEIINSQRNIRAEFENLWLKENHIYALDWITDKFDEKINNFVSVRNLLLKSLRNFDSSKPILSKEEVRLAITKLPGKYFTEWMMTNPIINKDNNSLSKIDYLTDMGGEAEAVPKVTQEFYFEGQKYRWRRVVSEYPDIVNLSEIFPDENANKVIYAFANISCDEEMSVTPAIGCDEGIEVFINGKKVYEKLASGKMTPDEFRFELPLQKGKNNLLIKSSQTSGGWAFTFRLPGKSVRNTKNRYRIVH
ncbi:MAG: family 20 glycosylhydrolase [Ignavibacterium sp.]|nr:MAG: family 20 glycosylhydrolase [Ignavibacterium sp.]